MKKKSSIVIILRIVAGIVFVLLLLFFLKGNIYRMAVKYEDDGGRKSYKVEDENLAKFINENLPNDEALDQKINIDMIVDFSQEMAAKVLDFSQAAKENDPQKTIISGTANYEGYAAFAAAAGNFLINMYLGDEWEAKPRKAKLYLFGSNKTKDAPDGWYKGHDIVVYRNKDTKEEIYIDPAAYESYGARRVDKYRK